MLRCCIAYEAKFTLQKVHASNHVARRTLAGEDVSFIWKEFEKVA